MDGGIPLTMEFNIEKIEINGRYTYLKGMQGFFNQGITHIKGANGSGKTTFLKTLVGIYDHIGYCTINGTSLKSHPVAYKSRVGFCPDSYTFSESISPREYLTLVSLSYAIEPEGFVDQAQAIGLYSVLDEKIKNLSYGNRKKLLLLASSMHNPLIWILDEPANGLDNQGKNWLEERLDKRQHDGIILLTCHDSWIDKFSHDEYQIQ